RAPALRSRPAHRPLDAAAGSGVRALGRGPPPGGRPETPPCGMDPRGIKPPRGSSPCGAPPRGDPGRARPRRAGDMSKTVSDFLVERLARWGVRRVFGYPGDGINGITGAM